MKKDEIGFFDPKADFSILERALPHWSQAGTVCFVTWRLNDSLPVSVLERLDREIEETLASEGLDHHSDWKSDLAQRDVTARGRVQWKLFAIRDRFLDEGHGRCLLARKNFSKIVEASLKRFDEDRYFLTDAVIMPNHVHFLAAFANEASMLKQCAEWKRFTGRAINKPIGDEGKFWQVDQFDHLIRSPEQFEHYRRYIAENPIKAHLSKMQFRHFAKQLT